MREPIDNPPPFLHGAAKALERMARDFEERARVARAAIKLFLSHQHAVKNGRGPAVLDAAAVIDRARRGHRQIPKRTKPGYGGKEQRAKRRAVTAALLATFDTTTPRLPPPSKGRGSLPLGPLLAHGYLKRKGKKGYLRTAKPFAAVEAKP